MGTRKALAWLSAHDIELDAEARRRFYAAYDELPAEAPHRDAYLYAAAQFLAGSLAPEDAGAGLAHSRSKAEEHFAAARAVGKLAVGSGQPEARVAAALGVDRMTLRKWQGKR